MPYCLFLESPSRGYFGSFPTQDEIDSLYDKGVRLFICLTETNEPGTGSYNLRDDCINIHFPIVDKYAPENWEKFSCLLITICDLIHKQVDFYVHCRAGHGRSSTVCTSLLCNLNKELHPETAIKLISKAHASREGLGPKWLRVTNPLSRVQQIFIYKFFSSIYFCKSYPTGVHVGFSSFSAHSVTFNNIIFPTAESAFQYHVDPHDTVFVNKLIDTKKPTFIKLVGDDHWQANVFDKFQIMYKICKLKYIQNPELKPFLLRTFMRRLVDGGVYSHSDNLVGRVLMKLREDLLREEFSKE